MAKIRRIKKIIRRTPGSGGPGSVARPQYTHDPLRGGRMFLAVESFKKHMSDEGWQLQEGMRLAGYNLWGNGYTAPRGLTDVKQILREAAELCELPGIVIIQDKREWDPASDCCLDPRANFQNAHVLAEDPKIFKLTVAKDLHQKHPLFIAAANQLGIHAWITYYHPLAVAARAPYIRQEHIVRTYHSVDSAAVPAYHNTARRKCILSGCATRQYYPLRHRLYRNARYLPLDAVEHPGYHAEGHDTRDYLFMLSQYKVAICTASIFGYALRKIIEATACGCRVITDLPAHDALPEIDANLTRVAADVPLQTISDLINELADSYDAERQEEFAKRAVAFYDYRRRASELAANIEHLRANWS